MPVSLNETGLAHLNVHGLIQVWLSQQELVDSESEHVDLPYGYLHQN